MSTPPWPHLQSHIHIHIHIHSIHRQGLRRPWTHTPDLRNVSGLVPSGLIFGSESAKGVGPLFCY